MRGKLKEIVIAHNHNTYVNFSYEYKSLKALVYALLTTSRPASDLARRILEPLAKNHGIDMDSVLSSSIPPIGDRDPIKIGIMAGQNATVGNQWFTINTGMLNPGYMLNILTFAVREMLTLRAPNSN